MVWPCQQWTHKIWYWEHMNLVARVSKIEGCDIPSPSG